MADDPKRDDKLLVLPLGEESKLITQTIANDTARQILELLADSAMSTSAIAKKLDIPLTTAQYNVEKLIEAGLVIVEKTKYSEKGREVKLYAPAKRVIVLVPRNTGSQAIMDALRKYLVLLPIAAVLAVFVEFAMQLRNSGFSLKESLPSLGSLGPGSADVTQAAENGSYLSMNDNMANATNSNFVPPVPAPAANETAKAATDGLLTNATDGVRSALAGNGTQGNMTAGGMEANLTFGDPGTVAGGAHRPLAAAEPSSLLDQIVQGITSFDPLGHAGLWFFVGCVLIIGILVAYELHRAKKAK